MYQIREKSWEPGLCEQFIKMLGIYPVGSVVSLTIGYDGIVSECHFDTPLYPTVLVCRSPSGANISPPQSLDLSVQKDVQIIKALPANALDVTLADLLETP